MEESPSSAESNSFPPLKALLQKVTGLIAAVITDLEGVTLAWAIREDSEERLEDLVRSTEEASIAAEQADKLNMGRSKYIVVNSGEAVLVYFISPLLLTKLVAEKSVNTGMLVALEDDVRALSNDLVEVLKEGQEAPASRVIEEA
eukprot:CAMPEP_0198728938 /NCGR_PEP_ID=MMETSP1475-20131203/12346_1 /TAXON_ID= ORGANISM="Unidentified sp., Strain CCMP1999" /NCGR_SAMPLE_ID=MMETSP1475 /ASSEMBLY_ACC=CAM_ASM_001111 /LENGTH=144 /DNA_ID=CAMNT_0044491437 /DNA_START=53 /DNA_END=487 /DNA_ORIENTATION=+